MDNEFMWNRIVDKELTDIKQRNRLYLQATTGRAQQFPSDFYNNLPPRLADILKNIEDIIYNLDFSTFQEKSLPVEPQTKIAILSLTEELMTNVSGIVKKYATKEENIVFEENMSTLRETLESAKTTLQHSEKQDAIKIVLENLSTFIYNVLPTFEMMLRDREKILWEPIEKRFTNEMLNMVGVRKHKEEDKEKRRVEEP